MHLQVFFFSLSLPHRSSLSILLHRTGFPINPPYSLIPYTPLTNSSAIQKCHSSSHCHPHFQPSPPSAPICSRPQKQLKQFSCRELLSLIAMKDTFSHHSLGIFFSPTSVSLSLRLGGSVGIATERGLSERGHNYILQYARRWQGFYAS